MRVTPAVSAKLDWSDRYCLVLLGALAGYAVGGKAFAYIGVAPLYISELVLAAGLMTMLLSGCTLASLASVPSILLVALMLLTIARTVPFVAQYGFDAVRDSVLVMYEDCLHLLSRHFWCRSRGVCSSPLRFCAGSRAYTYLSVPRSISSAQAPCRNTCRGPSKARWSPWVRAGELGVHLSACAVPSHL